MDPPELTLLVRATIRHPTPRPRLQKRSGRDRGHCTRVFRWSRREKRYSLRPALTTGGKIRVLPEFLPATHGYYRLTFFDPDGFLEALNLAAKLLLSPTL